MFVKINKKKITNQFFYTNINLISNFDKLKPQNKNNTFLIDSIKKY